MQVLPGISDWGAAYSLNAMVRGDAYRIDDYYISQNSFYTNEAPGAQKKMLP